jgi:hypothetical protein
MTKDTENEIMASLEQRLHVISGTIDDALTWERVNYLESLKNGSIAALALSD